MIGERRFLKEITDRIQIVLQQGDYDPRLDDVERAMSAVYYASTRQEEGEKILPNLLLIRDSDLVRVRSMVPVLEFPFRERLTPDLLRKRSLAFDRSNSTFLAVPEPEHLQIVGIAFWGWRGEANTRPMKQCPGVRFEAQDAGTISISLGPNALGLFRDGNFYETRPNVFSNLAFRNCLRETFYGLSNSHDAIDSFCTGLQHLVQSAMRHRRGGTIIVVHDRKAAKLESCYEAGRKVVYVLPQSSNGTISVVRTKETFDIDFEQPSIVNLGGPRRAYLEFVGRLSCIDGALILGPNLEPILMGAKLKTPTPEISVYLGGDEKQSEPPSLEGFGTRHTSAMSFVNFFERSIAFTISSDGPVSAFGWQDGRLSWWKNAVEPRSGD